jgi:photosystem II stability/assembly factor-like uncharacterized protein
LQASGTVNPITCITFIDANTGWIVGYYGTVIKTTNGGINWNLQVSNVGNDLYSVYFIDSQSGWIASEYDVENSVIIKTTNGGINWIPIAFNDFTDFYSIHFKDSQTGWAIGDRYNPYHAGIIFQTTNGGNNWILQRETPYPLLHMYFFNSQTGWVVGHGGYIYRTSNGGVNWIEQQHVTSESMRFHSVCFPNAQTGWVVGQNGTILTTVNGGSVFIRENSVEFPKNYLLSQNYPNPFNPTTKIEFSIPKSGFVTLRVFDITGRQVSILVNEKLNAGKYSYNWSGSGLSSGVYFYKIESDKFTAVKKMVLIK